MGRDVDIFMVPMQALGYLPEDTLGAENECKRILDMIESTGSIGVEDESDVAEVTKLGIDEAGIRQLLKRAKITGDDTEDAKAALAIFQVERLIATAMCWAEEESEAPRVGTVRKRLETIMREAPKLATILEDKYTLAELDLAQAIEDNEEDNETFLQEPDADDLSQALHRLSGRAKRALERQELYIKGGDVQSGAGVLDDAGGARTATSLAGFPAKLDFVVQCLAVFEEHRPEEWSTHPDGPFVSFAQSIWESGTGKAASLEAAIKDVFNMLKSGKDRRGRPVSAERLLDLRLSLKDRT